MKISGVYSQVVSRYSFTQRKPAGRLIVMLPGAGCAWYKEGGGCSMCGFHASVHKFSRGHILPSILFKLMCALALAENRRAYQMAIFNGGSFLNDREIPLNFQNWLFKRIGRHGKIGELFIESRCEYLEARKIELAVEMLGEKKLVVGIGLESQDERIRNQLIRKGLPRILFEKKIKMLKSLGAISHAYVFFKPLGLSENEALQDAIATIKYALDAGVDRLELSCAFVQENTPMHRAYQDGAYSLPWLWSVVQIIREAINKQWPLAIGAFTDEPPPIDAPHNCLNCTPAINLAIEKYRKENVLGDIPDCSCLAKWQGIMQKRIAC
ncbi:MAG TPA: hypothetical protein VMD74_00410 [Candidatus Methylomirabilis sp.]|nr:hypothetical protein [Candidatus Methylomirabilis sp.]